MCYVVHSVRRWETLPIVEGKVMKVLLIRKYEPADCKYLTELFYQTVHSVNAKDYAKEQLDAWASGCVDLEEWNSTLSEHLAAVAVEGDVIVGFGDIDKTGYLDRLYVHRDYQNQGIATAVCNALENAVQTDKITVHASITAKPFFLSRGYVVRKEQQVLRRGVYLKNYVCEKLRGITIRFGEMETAISIMKEVAAWGRGKGYRVWPDEWLTPEELITPDAGPESFCIGSIDGEEACAFILQWADSEYWPNAPEYEAAYLHKFCVRRCFAGMGMTSLVVDAVRAECRKRGVRRIRLDTGLDEKAVRRIYLNAGFKIVDIIDYPNGGSMALYELEV